MTVRSLPRSPEATPGPQASLDLRFDLDQITPPGARVPQLSTDAWARELAAPTLSLPPVRVLFAGGGTGGHLYPAIAIERALAEVAPGSAALFVGSERPLEKQILASAGCSHRALPTAPWRGLRGALRFGVQQARGVLASRRLLKEWKPDVVVGLGGFPSVGPALAARLAGVPLALFEPNAVPGKANRLLARLASEAYVHWANTELGCLRIRSGTPLDARAMPGPELSPIAARQALGLPPELPLVLIMGGSQGSAALNTWVEESLAAGAGSRDVAYLHLAGSDEASERLRAAYEKAGCTARVERFLGGIGLAYRAASLAIVRGGGATLAEAQAIGLPAVVVPMPGSADDHQRRNAEAFVAEGGVRVLEERDLEPNHLRQLNGLAQDEGLLLEHSLGARAAGRPDAANVVARRLVSLAHEADDTTDQPTAA